MDKQEVLNEVLRGIGHAERLGLKQLDCEDISPWGFDEVSEHVIKELDKLGYKLYAFHYFNEEDGNDVPCGLNITWE